ncbi:ATP-dependent helicase HrpB [Commensalibacter papalotli (ex Servin-Garciduenas et al. 2014)]|uniref:ATP-dependent helicase HrpB n=1 Tax=Commensalibacter papalotli (ex Servin-Garciduenas et al. 2014) TaxID=1208583 RepID=W7E055_9PROT|nr:ATP-dependent helicase HrpB [Commensalibacter papalotli (ex Servin-Garciduenas et al. 2014)]EUK18314.1 ATP-dependent helicase HrpB [Commensalibacter papalotli (ex Servin-Garciduenas et al. 2014)]
MYSIPNISLPIQSTLPKLYDYLNQHPNVILVAPPGTGKTSLVPLSLQDAQWVQSKKLIMLEPRRIATRAAARQMAHLSNEEVGKTIGYRTRMDKAISAQTKIEVVTQGLFLRRLLNNPLLDDVAGIIFDEIHERSLDADLCLGLCRNLQANLRPDLRLIAMSATPSLTNLQKILHCDIIESKTDYYPITTHHRKRDLTHIRDLSSVMAAQITEAYHSEKGNILAFLPGAGEIHKTINLLSLPNAEILPLYGDLPATEQDKALRPASDQTPRRIVLATSIAETSLTVPGVRIVIDGGYRRMPQLNADTGLTRLQTQRISKAAATQRAGRAGREGEGVVYKLWTQATERSLPLHDRPEILEAELSEFLLVCQTWSDIMGIEISDIPFPDKPSLGVMEAAKELLILLGCLDHKGHITKFGHKVAQFGAHPRLACMMLSARSNEEKALAADIASLLEERDPLRHEEPASVDIKLRFAWLHQPPISRNDQGLWHRIRKINQDYRKRLQISAMQPPAIDPALLICAAFPDRLAQRRSEIGSFRLAGGGAAHLSPQDPFAKEGLLAVASVHVHKRTNICLAFPVKIQALSSFIEQRSEIEQETTLDTNSGKVIIRERLKFGRLTLQDRNIIASTKEAIPVLFSYIKNNLSKTLNWDEQSKQLLARYQIAQSQFSFESLPDLSEKALIENCEAWLLPWMNGLTCLNEVKQLNVADMLEAYLGYTVCKDLNQLLPKAISLNNHKIYIDYTQAVPVVSAPAKYFFGLNTTPTIAKGKIALQCCLLSPANRPQAITSDLQRFWHEGWKDMRKDMKGRYPKHHWPENPAIASEHKS